MAKCRARIKPYDFKQIEFEINDAKRRVCSIESNPKWGINGNNDTASDSFLGTTNEFPITFKVNNERVGYISLPYNGVEGEARGITQDILIGNNAGNVRATYPYGIIAIGSQALKNFQPAGTWAWNGQVAVGNHALENSTVAGNTSIGEQSSRYLTTGRRNTTVGQGSSICNISGSYNTHIGQFSGEWCPSKNSQVFVGSESGRGGGGDLDVFIGVWAGYFSGGAITGANITNGGSGYTTATVLFSSPVYRANGYHHEVTATGTATIVDGVITEIVMTNIGRGYNSADTHTITITGDGNGATATPILSYPEKNTLLGGQAGWQQQIGKNNIMIGYNSGIGTNASLRDTYCGYIGDNASRLTSLSSTTYLTNAWAIGRTAQVGKDNMMAIGSPYTDAYTLSVGIGATTTDNSAKLQIDSVSQGFLPPRMTGTQAEAISTPAEGLLIYSTDGSGVTITSKGWWGYNGTIWEKLN